MTDAPKDRTSPDTRTVVLVEDVKGLGKAGELTRVSPERADALVTAGKVRRATIEDFPAAKR